jgi:6-phosphogluconate dehydrogenase
MEIGLVGLGKMGLRMATRLVRGGHRVVGYDSAAEAQKALADAGGEPIGDLAGFSSRLAAPRAVWAMVPAGEATETTVGRLTDLLSPGDVVLDGGNSNYRDSIRRGAALKARGLHFLDVGTSGGVWGLENGYALMIGGDADAARRLGPIFETLAPAKDRGWGRVGPSGAGHFVKMIHNGIEYGMMQAFAEGFALLDRKEELDLDLPQIAEIWRHGSVVRSWLLDLIARALSENPTLEGIAPWVSDSGEGRWTVQEAIDQDLTAPVITLALMQRFRSREKEAFAEKLLAAMRFQFGGHQVKTP